ncbi:interleukin-6 [Sarcophilus harrisii]|uniref:Interleukin-6 n=1 Tax=Sarcophilus harrisii TaxID=9305 RepID=G3WCK1_SARHA|nr:interleukin-6 [Sarcophilus harrisii]
MGPQLQITGSLGPLAFTLVLLVTTAARPTPDALGVSSKPALGTTDLGKCKSLAKTLYKEADALKEENGENQSMCDNSSTILAENNLVFPNLTEQDGCFYSGFNKETCLINLISKLQEFDGYFQFMENELKEKKSRIEALKMFTTQLAESLKKLMMGADLVPTLNPTASHDLVLKLKSLNEWSRKVALHLSLCRYIKFMEHTIRAIRNMDPTDVSV